MKQSPITGTCLFIGFILRRDRIRLTVWLAAIVLCSVLMAVSVVDSLPTEADRMARAEFIQNPANIALTGPGHGIENYTYGAMIANELGFLVALAVALMNIFLVVRHSRAEEESGRMELVRAAVIGRYSPLTATLLVAISANILLAVLIALGLIISLDLTVIGSLTFGLWLSALGIVFSAITAVIAQLTQHARTASGMGGMVLGLSFVLRAVGDIQGNGLSMLSPIGWGQATRPFVDERLWPVFLSLGFAVALCLVAYYLNSKRDLGVGMLRPKPGPTQASKLLSWPMGLVFRLQRGSIISWLICFTLAGLFIGAVGQESMVFIEENPQLEEFYTRVGEGSLIHGAMGVFLRLVAILVAVFGIKLVSHLAKEERQGMAENVLSTAVSRGNYLGSYLMLGGIGSLIALALVGLGAGLSFASASGDSAEVIRLFTAALVNVSAVWLIMGLAVALMGLAPKLKGLVWMMVAYGVVSELLGPLLQLPDWTNRLSPFHIVPNMQPQVSRPYPLR